MHFNIKNNLKSNHHHTVKHSLNTDLVPGVSQMFKKRISSCPNGDKFSSQASKHR